MGEGFKRKLPQGPLTNTGKDHIAQLLKAHGHQPRQTVSQRQPNGPQPQDRRRSRPFGCQSINRLFIKNRRAHGDDLGQKQHRQRNHDTAFDPRLPLWPQIWHHTANNVPALNPGIA